MAKYCPKCGKEHIHNEEYCVDCHTKLPDEKLELNDKTPDSIFKSEKNEKPKKTENNSHLDKIFTYERTGNKQENSNPKRQNDESLIFKPKNNGNKEKTASKTIVNKSENNSQKISTIKSKKKIIGIGIIVLIILVGIFIGVSLNSMNSNNNNQVENTQYNTTDFDIKIPSSFEKVDDANYIAKFEGNNTEIKLYQTSLSENGYSDATIGNLMDIIGTNIGNNEGGTVQTSQYINISNTEGYNITYTSGDNITRDIGFIIGDNEYDIIITTEQNNENYLDTLSNNIVNSIKINNNQ